MDDPTAPPRTPSSSSSQLNTPPQPALLRPVHAQQLYLATSTAPPVPEVSGRRISESNRIRPDGESPHHFETFEQHLSEFKNSAIVDSTTRILAARKFTGGFRIETVSDDNFGAFHDSSWHFFGPILEAELRLSR
ncbi:hypothetical protein FF1_035300 [Malus domestica]